ncbi:MAG: hypothetical protein R6X13_11135 [bacterium]
MNRRVRRPFFFVLFSLLSVSSLAFGCTIGAFGGGSTADGRAVLWKNRDVDNQNQELRFWSHGRYRYVSNAYSDDTLNAWGGINEAGFGIMNSNAYNLGPKLPPKGPDDGNIMALALATCASLEDFEKLLDSLNIVGRETPANYGVLDSTGDAAIFESSNTWYIRCDAAADSLGYTLRANYSFSGDSVRLRGLNRYRRAFEVCSTRRAAGPVDIRFVLGTLARDLGQPGFSPYPLPFTGTLGSLPEGYLPTDTTVCRLKTRSVEVIVGPRPGGGPGTGMVWYLPGSPLTSLPIPAWVAAESVPATLDGPDRAVLCDEAIRLRDHLHSYLGNATAINTRTLAVVLDHFAPVESTIYRMVDSCEAAWPDAGPDPMQAWEVTNRACSLALDAYQSVWDRLLWQRLARYTVPGPESTPTVVRGPGRVPVPADFPAGRAAVFDAAGRRVADLVLSPGQGTFDWPPAQLGSGNYFLMGREGSEVRLLRLAYVR